MHSERPHFSTEMHQLHPLSPRTAPGLLSSLFLSCVLHYYATNCALPLQYICKIESHFPGCPPLLPGDAGSKGGGNIRRSSTTSSVDSDLADTDAAAAAAAGGRGVSAAGGGGAAAAQVKGGGRKALGRQCGFVLYKCRGRNIYKDCVHQRTGSAHVPDTAHIHTLQPARLCHMCFHALAAAMCVAVTVLLLLLLLS